MKIKLTNHAKIRIRERAGTSEYDNFIKDEFDIQYIYLNESAELSAFPRDFMDQARQSIVELIRLRKEKKETKM